MPNTPSNSTIQCFPICNVVHDGVDNIAKTKHLLEILSSLSEPLLVHLRYVSMNLCTAIVNVPII